MFKLDEGNVLLKPSHRRQLMNWLRRTLRYVHRLGEPTVTMSMRRIGRLIEIKTDVATARGGAVFRVRQHDWRHAAREMIRMITTFLHDQSLRVAMS